MNLKTLFQQLEHEILHATVNCGSALHLLEHYLSKPGVVNEEHLPEVNRRLSQAMDSLRNVEKVAAWEDEEPIYDSAGFTEQDR